MAHGDVHPLYCVRALLSPGARMSCVLTHFLSKDTTN